MKLLFCHDTSDAAQEALDKTLKYFSCQRPEIILLTVVEGPLDASMENEGIYEELNKKIHDKHHKIAKDISTKGFDVDALIATGDSRKMILEAAKNKTPDLIVVGKRGAGALKEMILGSVAAYVVRHSPYPVLVMPT